MVTFCGGEPSVSETVKVTLWWKEILCEEGVGSETVLCGSVWSFKGNMKDFCRLDEREEELLVWI
jgi:hypothetical protein